MNTLYMNHWAPLLNMCFSDPFCLMAKALSSQYLSMAAFLYHPRCSESGSEQEFGWKGEPVIRQDGSVSEERESEMQAACTHFLFSDSLVCVFLFESRSGVRAASESLQLHDFKSRHFQPSKFFRNCHQTRPRFPSHDSWWILCSVKLSDSYLLCPTETAISLRLIAKVNIKHPSHTHTHTHTHAHTHCWRLSLLSLSHRAHVGLHVFVYSHLYFSCVGFLYASLPFSLFGLHDFHIICLKGQQDLHTVMQTLMFPVV